MTAHPWLKRFSRAFGASLLLLVLGGAGVAAAADIGHQDFAATGEAITGSKPESKLWYNDGTWWASMWSAAPTPGFYIYRLDTSTETWIRTNTALDNRAGSRADTLWDGTPSVRRLAGRERRRRRHGVRIRATRRGSTATATAVRTTRTR